MRVPALPCAARGTDGGRHYRPIMRLTPSQFQLKNPIIPWSFEPAGLQPRKTNC
jgi:hypothetical protein